MKGWPIFAMLVQCSLLCWNVAAQRRRHSRCYDQATVPDFDITRFTTGRWYEKERNGNEECACSSIDYILLPDNKLNISVNANCQMAEREVSNSIASLSSYPGKFVTDSWPSDYTYYIIDTDYDNYAVFWACKSSDSHSIVYISGLAREKDPPPEILDTLHKIISKYIITGYEAVYPIDQVNC